MFSLKKSLTRLTLLAVASTAVVGTLSGPSHAATIGGTVGVIGDKVVFVGKGSAANKIEVMRGTDRIIVLETNPALTLATPWGPAAPGSTTTTCSARSSSLRSTSATAATPSPSAARGPGNDTLFAHVTLLSTGNPTVIPEADSADLSCGTGTDRIYVDTADGAASECEDRQLIR